MPFALRSGQLFGTEGYRYGMDLIVSDFFANPKNSGYTWNREWINSFFELLKEIGWNVITYRSGALPELWQEMALYQGILLVDQNGMGNGQRRRTRFGHRKQTWLRNVRNSGRMRTTA